MHYMFPWVVDCMICIKKLIIKIIMQHNYAAKLQNDNIKVASWFHQGKWSLIDRHTAQIIKHCTYSEKKETKPQRHRCRWKCKHFYIRKLCNILCNVFDYLYILGCCERFWEAGNQNCIKHVFQPFGALIKCNFMGVAFVKTMLHNKVLTFSSVTV